MDSKNNNDRHRFEREYFDAPHAYLHRGFQFKSVYTKPHLLTSAGRIASNAGELESPLTLQTATSRHLSVLDPGSPYKVKNPEILPVTNGMTETQLNLLARSPMGRSSGYGSTFGGRSSPGLKGKKRLAIKPSLNQTFTAGFA